MFVTRLKLLVGKVSALPFLRDISSIPSTRLETLSWVLTIKTNVAVGLLSAMLLALLIPGIPSNNIYYLVGCLIGYMAFATGIRAILRRDNSEKFVGILTEVLIPIEITISTIGIFFTGGALTPMFMVYTLSIMMSIILLNPWGVYKATAFTIFQYVVLAVLEAFEIIPRFPAIWGDKQLYAASNFSNYGAYILIVCCTLISIAYIGHRIARLIKERNVRIESQVTDLRSIYSISHNLGNMTNDIAIAQYLAPTLRDLHNATITIISLVDTNGKPNIVAHAGLSSAEVTKVKGREYTELPGFSELFQCGEPLILEDTSLFPKFADHLPDRKINSVYAFPMLADEKVIGTISLLLPERKALNEEYIELLKTIANQAGVAVQRARLFRATQRLANEMSALYNVGLHTGSTLSITEVIKRTANNMEKLLHPDMFYIALYNADSETVVFEHFLDHGEFMPKMCIPVGPAGSSLTSTIIHTKQPVLVYDWDQDGKAYDAIAQKTGTEMLSYLGVPMIFDDRVVGVLSVQGERANIFDDESTRLLKAMAAQTAMALENAHLHTLSQEAATLDSLTNVYNHGHFVRLAQEAITTSNKNDSQVSLIMIDIDLFKQYNDTFGHVIGDKVLALTAQAIKGCVREGDSVGRWGGEEFAVLLPGMNSEGAKKVARRIRRAVADLSLLDIENDIIASPTISQGISTFPYPAHDADKLIEYADAALYYAKENGRNQLVVFDLQGTHELIYRTGFLGTTETKQYNRPTYATTHHKNSTMHDATITTGHLNGPITRELESISNITHP